MYLNNAQIHYSPSDLTVFLESPFASLMDHYNLINPSLSAEPDCEDEMMGVLQSKGNDHERNILEVFLRSGVSVVDASVAGDKRGATQEAMKEGADVIFQAALSKGVLSGYADFLVKVDGSSDLGDYHYEVWDSKLSKTVKPSFTIQLCAYQYMLQQLQGRYSDEFVVVLSDGVKQRYRTEDYIYYFLSVEQAFVAQHQNIQRKTLPNPAHSNTWGRWSTFATMQLEEADHLSQVASLSKMHIKKLEAAGVLTMTQLAETPLERIPGISQAIFKRIQTQAMIQGESEGQERPAYKIIVPGDDEKVGLALLPPESKLDVFFDIEGYPLEEGGLEYLWGNTYFDENNERQFKDFWAHNREQEKSEFTAFIEWVYGRWQKDSSMHIYHYANYEIAACRKLMGRYGVCEYEVDQLLRNEVFVDLYKVVKSGMVLGEPKYSIKNVENLYRDKRDTAVGNGGDSVVVYERWRANPDGGTWQTSKILNDLRAYNIDDCESTQELVVWLRARQKEYDIHYSGLDEVVEPEVSEEDEHITQLRDRLLKESMNEVNKAQANLIENMAWLLEFHRREAKPVFWKLFDRLGTAAIDLVDDLECLACCERTDKEPFKSSPRAKNLAYEYRFDRNQEFKQTAVSSFYILGLESEGGMRTKANLVKGFSDFSKGIVCVQSKEEPPSSITLVPDDYVRPDPIPQALQAVIQSYEQGRGQAGAIFDFLERKPPRIATRAFGAPIASSPKPSEKLLQIVDAIENLDNSYLPIQGPPGAGKTFTGKHVIAALLKKGKSVGISSNSHKAINNLLIGSAQFCQDEGVVGQFACTKDTDPSLLELGVSILKNPKLSEFIDSSAGACVVGTTAWGFSRDDMVGKIDYLFIDEAGQVSVANLVAMSRSTRNIILLGDQMQLGQPAQGSHPADSGLSILDYLLKEQSTIPDHMGVFLGTTYRMHSLVNQFISQAIYDGKLMSDPKNDSQRVLVPDAYEGELNKEAGIIAVPVEHEGNTQASDEEVEKIVALARELEGRCFTDKRNHQRKITLDDILFVAPYNFQVNKLREALGEGAHIGSVDKFQGQEAPIVILSMCASDAEESVRGVDFIFDKNRINVAVSRAQSLAIIVASPKLMQVKASSLEQQVKVNLMCRLFCEGKGF